MKHVFLMWMGIAITTCAYCQNKTYNILAYGAKGDGNTNCTLSIQAAIDKAVKSGGGKVIIPSGRFMTGVIRLKSGVELCIEKDAVLLASTSRLDYGGKVAEALITARGQTGISITGKGEIDGRGRELVKDLLRLLHRGDLKDDLWKIKRPGEGNRPELITFYDCKNVKVTGITARNSAGWVQTYKNCLNVAIDSMTIISTEYWNNDGIDIVNSKNVSITNCYVDAADDAICLKSEGGPGICQNIYVANCTLRSSASAFKLGTGSFGGFKNIKVENLVVFNTYRSAIALEAVDGGFIENVDIKNVKGTYTGNAILIRLGHRNNTDAYSYVKKVRISDVTVDVPAFKPDAGYPTEGPALKYEHNVFPTSITGLPGHDVEDVVLENITVNYEGGGTMEKAYFGWDTLHKVPENPAGYPEFSMFGELPCWGLYVRHVNGLVIKNLQLGLQNADYRPSVIFDDVKALTMDKIIIPYCNTIPVMILNNVSGERLDNIKIPGKENESVKKTQLR